MFDYQETAIISYYKYKQNCGEESRCQVGHSDNWQLNPVPHPNGRHSLNIDMQTDRSEKLAMTRWDEERDPGMTNNQGRKHFMHGFFLIQQRKKKRNQEIRKIPAYHWSETNHQSNLHLETTENHQRGSCSGQGFKESYEYHVHALISEYSFDHWIWVLMSSNTGQMQARERTPQSKHGKMQRSTLKK